MSNLLFSVQRLNAVLAEYQHKYPSFTPTAAASGQVGY